MDRDSMSPSPLRLFYAALIMIFAGPAAAEARDLDVPIIWPRGSRWYQQVDRAANKIEQRTGGRVKVRLIHEPVLNDVPGIALYSLPLVFKNEEEIDYVRERMDSSLIDILATKGYTTIGIEGLGMAHIFSKKELRLPDHLLASRLWTPDEKGGDVLKRFGVREIVPVDIMDVRKALDANKLDTLVTVPSSVVLARWQDGVDFVADWPLLYVYSPLVVKNAEFDALLPKDQQTLRETLGDAFKDAGASSRRMTEQAWGVIRKREKIQFLSQTDEERRAWETWADSVRQQLIDDGRIPAAMAAELDRHLKAAR